MARPVPWLAPAVYAGGLMPLGLLALQWSQGELGADPVKATLHQLGRLGLIGLLASLACTPLQTVTGWTWPARVRRALGLVGFTYVTLHLLFYLAVDQRFAFGTLLDDVARRPFITVGFLAWLLLVPLALTSTAGAVRRLGYVRWKRLHRLVYAVGALGVLHFAWGQKKDVSQPLAYAAVLALLLAVRLGAALRRARRRAAR